MQQFTDFRSRSNAASGGSSLLRPYLEGASRHAPLTAGQERDATLAIHQLLVGVWEALLEPHEQRLAVLAHMPAALRAQVSAELDTSMREQDDAESVRSVARILAARDLDRVVLDPILAALAMSQTVSARRARQAHRRWLSARNRFACTFLRFVVAVAARLGRSSWELEDRVQEGNLGLLKAIDRFDPGRGVRFTTYAAWWIRHAIIRALTNRARTVRVPSNLHTTFLKVRRARELMRTQAGRDPTVTELADCLGISVENITRAEEAMALRTVHLDGCSAQDDETSAADEVGCADEFDWGLEADDARVRVLADEAWPLLDESERDILTLRFGLDGAKPLSLQAIGTKYERSHERIRQRQNLALAKLREHIESSATTTCALLWARPQ